MNFGKYAFTFRTSLMEKLMYAGSMAGRVVVYAVLMFMFTRLWGYIYGSGEEGLVAGYTLNQMLWYVTVTELIFFSSRSGFIRGEIAADIKSGRIAYAINKPYNYVLFVLSKYFGETATGYAFNSIVGICVGLFLIGRLETFSFASLPFLFVTFFMATMVSAFVYLAIALVSFWVEENAPFIWIYEKLVLLLGIVFPIEIFPGWAQPFIRLTPVYPSIYAPARMAVAFSFDAWFSMLGVQAAYIAVLALVTAFIYSRGVRKLNVNGG